MREEISRYLSEFYDIRRVVVDKDWEANGVPAVKVEVYWNDGETRVVSTCTFHTALKLSAVEMGYTLASYMKKGLKV